MATHLEDAQRPFQHALPARVADSSSLAASNLASCPDRNPSRIPCSGRSGIKAVWKLNKINGDVKSALVHNSYTQFCKRLETKDGSPACARTTITCKQRRICNLQSFQWSKMPEWTRKTTTRTHIWPILRKRGFITTCVYNQFHAPSIYRGGLVAELEVVARRATERGESSFAK
jgi:hypothetical protein